MPATSPSSDRPQTITPQQRAILLALGDGEWATHGQLAERTGMERLQSILQTLRYKGFIEHRVTNHSHRYEYRLT